MKLRIHRDSSRKRTARRRQTASRDLPVQAQLREEIRQLRETLEVEKLILEAEQQSLAEAQQELESSRDRYADLFDFAPIGFATLDASGAITNLNLTGANLLGWERSFLINKPLRSLVSKAHRILLFEYLTQVRKSEHELKIQLSIARGQGDEVRLELTSVAARGSFDGRVRVRMAFRDVTEQWRAEQLPLVADIAPVMLARCSRDLRYLFVNEACAKFLGLPRSKIVSRPIAEVMGAQAFEAIRPYVEMVLQGRPVEFELPVLYARSAGRRFMRVAYRPEKDDHDNVVGWVAAISDITDRKQAEAELRDAHDRLEERVRERTQELQKLNSTLAAEVLAHKADALARDQLAVIVESSSDAILSRNFENILTSWNKGAERLFGYAAVEALGRSIHLIVPPERQEELRQADQRLRRGEIIEPFETVRLRKDGARLDVWLSLSPIKDSNGQITGISANERDIGDRKRAETALRETEARLRAIMDNSPTMIFLKDLQGRYLHVNRRFTEAFNLPAEKVVGKTDQELFPARQAGEFRAHDLKTLEAGSPMVFNEMARYEDGVHTSIVSKFPLFDLNGNIYALGGIVTDVTERKRLEEEIVRISEHEQQRIARDLHDGLGQQLAGTWFLSDTLRKSLAARSSPEVGDATKVSQLLQTAVGQIRNLARGLSPVPPEPNGLMAALQLLAAQCSELFAVDCRFSCPQPEPVEDPKVATHLYRIAQEAINNAVRHGKATKVEIELFARNGGSVLRIVDNGIGFKRTTKPAKGMGLRTMNYRADLVGADFAVNKRHGKGTEVICSLRGGNGMKS